MPHSKWKISSYGNREGEDIAEGGPLSELSVFSTESSELVRNDEILLLRKPLTTNSLDLLMSHKAAPRDVVRAERFEGQ